MNAVLVGLIHLINFVKDYKKAFGFVTAAVLLTVAGLSVASFDGSQPTTASGQQLVMGNGELATLSQVSPSVSREKNADKQADSKPAGSADTGKATASDTASQPAKTGTVQSSAAASTGTQNGPTGTNGSLSGAATADKPATNADASFKLTLVDSAIYKDQATNTVIAPYTISRDQGYTGDPVVSVTPNGNGVSCTVTAAGTVEMKLDAVLPADYYGCKLNVSDGKTTRTVDLTIHHSGGATNS